MAIAANGRTAPSASASAAVPTPCQALACRDTKVGNKEKHEKNTCNGAQCTGTFDGMILADKEKKMKLIFNLINKAAVPLQAMKVYSDVSRLLPALPLWSFIEASLISRVCLRSASTPRLSWMMHCSGWRRRSSRKFRPSFWEMPVPVMSSLGTVPSSISIQACMELLT